MLERRVEKIVRFSVSPWKHLVHAHFFLLNLKANQNWHSSAIGVEKYAFTRSSKSKCFVLSMSFKRLLRSGTGPTGSTSHFTACKSGPSNSVQTFMLSRASCCCNVVRNRAQPAGLICQQLKTLKTINKSVLYNIIYGKNMNNSQTMNICDLYVWLIQNFSIATVWSIWRKKENCHVEASRMMKVSEHYARHDVILNSVFGLKRLEHLTTLWFAESQLYFLSHLRCW